MPLRSRMSLTVGPEGSLTAGIRPAPGHFVAASRTGVFDQPVLQHLVPRSLHEHLTTGGTYRVPAIAPDVPFIHVVQPNLPRDLASPVQRLWWSVRFVAQLKIRMERCEMQRDFGPQMLEHPFG